MPDRKDHTVIMSIERFESVAAYLAHVAGTEDNYRHSRDWDLGIKGSEAVTRATFGDPEIGPSTAAKLDKLSPQIGTSDRPAWVPHVMGQRVSVPAYLAGNPMSMRRKVRQATESRHVAIYADLVSSIGIGASDLLARGTTILALLESLQRQNVACDVFALIPTHAANADGELIQVIRLESRPLDLSTSGFALAHPAFVRNVGYGYAERRHGFNGEWSESFLRYGGASRSTAYENHIRGLLGMNPTDIYIPPVYYGDPLISNPIAWIEARLSQITGNAA